MVKRGSRLLFCATIWTIIVIFLLHEETQFIQVIHKLKKYDVVRKLSFQEELSNIQTLDLDFQKPSIAGDLLTEQEYLDTPEPPTHKHCAHAKTSKMRLYNDKTKFDLNEEIKVFIELFDMNGHRLNRGGDLVRVWMREKSKQANCAGYVIDFRNGSYQGVMKAMWTGQPEILAEIAGARETVRTIYRVINGDPRRKYHATFKNANVSEETNCSAVPWTLHTADFCNLTVDNFGSEWYCRRPRNVRLLCHDYTSLRFSFGRLSLSAVEEDLLNRCHERFSRTVKIQIVSKGSGAHGDRVNPKLACNKRPFQDTWVDSTPVGYFYSGQWNPRMCRNNVKSSVDAYHLCLQNRRLLILGDSTTRQYFFYLQGRLKLTMETDRWSSNKWYKYSQANKKDFNYSVIWAPHEQPFAAGVPGMSPRYFRSIASYMDELPSSSRDFVWFHMYAHLIFSPPVAFRKRARRIAQAVKDLTVRAPNVKISVKGSYTFQEHQYYTIDDYWGKVYDNILREEFRDVRRNVLFLDYWDFTLGSENKNIHPNTTMVGEMIHYFMSYMCGR